jgi:hypothetical protein
MYPKCAGRAKTSCPPSSSTMVFRPYVTCACHSPCLVVCQVLMHVCMVCLLVPCMVGLSTHHFYVSSTRISMLFKLLHIIPGGIQYVAHKQAKSSCHAHYVIQDDTQALPNFSRAKKQTFIRPSLWLVVSLKRVLPDKFIEYSPQICTKLFHIHTSS